MDDVDAAVLTTASKPTSKRETWARYVIPCGSSHHDPFGADSLFQPRSVSMLDTVSHARRCAPRAGWLRPSSAAAWRQRGLGSTTKSCTPLPAGTSAKRCRTRALEQLVVVECDRLLGFERRQQRRATPYRRALTASMTAGAKRSCTARAGLSQSRRQPCASARPRNWTGGARSFLVDELPGPHRQSPQSGKPSESVR